MKHLVPPVAVPIGIGSIVASLVPRANESPADFEEKLGGHYGGAQVRLFGSGRAALAAALGAARRAGRDEVLLPAYTCWSVPAAAVRAGCRVRLYDVDPSTFLPAIDLQKATAGRVAAVVLADLLSQASGSAEAVEAAAERFPESLIVEDRAQSWPTRASASGVTVLSFGRGKPLPLGSGGALLASTRRLSVTPPALRSGGFTDAATLAAAALLGRPRLFRLPSSIPAIGLGTTVFEPAFDARRPFRQWQARLGLRVLGMVSELIRQRTSHAMQLETVVNAVPGWRTGPWSDGPLRLPVYAPDRQSRDRMISALRALGVAATPLYPGTILDIPALRKHLVDGTTALLGAREIADRLVTLPVYPSLAPRDLDRISRAFVHASRMILS